MTCLVKEIQRLLDYIPDPHPPLRFINTYTLLIAVLLSAQCTDERVNKVTETLFKKASTPEEMMKLSMKRFKTSFALVDLSAQGNSHMAAFRNSCEKNIVGFVPETLKSLEALPGVGHKTASVVLAQAFQPAFPVDTHIFRVARRCGDFLEKKHEAALKRSQKGFPPKKTGLDFISK